MISKLGARGKVGEHKYAKPTSYEMLKELNI